MSDLNRRVGVLRWIVPLALILTGALAAPANAAQEWSCDASALRATVLGSATVDPLRANAGQAGCRTDTAGVNTPGLPLALSVKALSAQTTLGGPAGAPAQQTAGASARVADLRIGALDTLPLPAPDFGDAGLIQLPVPLLGTIDVDLRPALQALLQPLPDLDLLRVQAVRADASATCVSGTARLTSTSSIAGLTIGGRQFAINEPITETIELVDTQSIDPSDIDLSKVVLPLGVNLGAVQALLRPLLDTLPTIEVPPTIARVRAVANRQIRAAGKLTQRALEVEVTVAGRPVAEVVAAEASVGAGDVKCATTPGEEPPGEEPPNRPPTTRQPAQRPPRTITDAALECTNRRIVLIDVLPGQRRVYLRGVADTKFAGRRVRIKFLADGRTVARPRVGTDGQFEAWAKLPARRLRSSNRARYPASIGKERSLKLKLVRRMRVERARRAGNTVVISGRLRGPLPRRLQPIVIKQRISCREWRVLGRATPRRNGRFRITVAGAEAGTAAVYRLQTRVAGSKNRNRLAPTFTLPRYEQF